MHSAERRSTPKSSVWRIAIAALIALALDAVAGSTQAQDYPSCPVMLLVPLGAGGAMDIIVRSIAPRLSERLGKSVLVENRVGADGYTLLIAPSGTPSQIVSRLHDEFKAATKFAEIWQQMTDMGLIPIDTPPVEELQNFVKAEIVRWGKLVQQVGIAGTE